MPSETTTSKVSLSTKPTESRWLAIANLPETATEDTIKECFKRHGHVRSVKIDDQRFAFVAFLDVRTASKAHSAENILDEQRLRTAFHDGSNSVPKALLEPPPILSTQPSSSPSIVLPEQPSSLTSTVIEPPSSSSSNTSNITTVTNTLSTKTINGDRDKRSSRTLCSPDENVRHQVVPVKRDSDSSGSKRKNSSTNLSKTANSSHPTIQKPPRRKHDNSTSSSSSSSSSESERSSDDSISCKNRRRNPAKTHASLNDSLGKSRILKIYHLPPKTPKESLRESLWNIFVDFKKSCRLLTVKIDGEHESRYALLTFRKSDDVDKALTFAITKSISGMRLKAEPYDGLTNENDECEIMKRSICTDPDIDEYSIKATRTLYIGNLQSEISYNELREAYSAFGDIIELEIKRQTQTQHQLPFAFVQYADIKSVVKAMKASESKLIRDHSIKLGFGKSQPTNVLWLDDLPVNIIESTIRTFITRITNLPNDQVLDIYIDNRNSHKSQTAQCLIYFTDTRIAQEAINLIRGKKLESKRVQVDFASKVFVTRFSDIIEEISHKKNYVGYPPDSNYHGESRSVSKRNGAPGPETIPTFDNSSTRTNSSDRWSNAYNNSNRSQHKNETKHSSDRRHSKEYGKGTNNSLISIPSADNGIIPGPSLNNNRRPRLSTSSKDSLSNNLSSGRNPHRSSHTRHPASSTSSSSSRSSSTSSHNSTSTNSLEHRSNSNRKRPITKHSKKPSKLLPNNLKPSGKKSSSNKEHSTKSSHRSRVIKSEKDNDTSSIIPIQQSDPVILPNLTLDDQIDSIKKEPSPAKQQQQQTAMHSSTSPKAPLKNTERVFDWLMQNHHQDSNSSMGLDQNDDEETLLKRKPDDDSLENVSDEQTSKTSPPLQINNLSISTNMKSSLSLIKNAKNEKSLLTSAYRLQPIRTGNKRDDQMDSSLSVTEMPSSSPPPQPPQPPPPLSASLSKDDPETPVNHRRLHKTKFHLSANQTKPIPLDSISSYDQLDVRLKSYPSLFNDHTDTIRLPFPQFAFEHIKTSTTSSNVLVVLNPKAHLKHSSLGLNNSSIIKHETSIDTNNNDEELSTTRIPLDERIRLLDKQMYEMNHGQQKSTTSSSSSSSSSSLSPATLIEQQNQKITTVTTTITTITATNNNNTVKSVNELVSTPSATLAQCIQAARAAALNAQPTSSTSPSKTTSTITSSSPFAFPVTSVPSIHLNRAISATSPSPINISSVLPPPPTPPFSSLQRLADPLPNSILTTFHAAIAQNQIAAVKYNPMSFANTLHPPPPPVPASLITLNPPPTPPPTLTTPSNNNLISTLSCPPSSTSSSSSSISLPHRSTPTNLLSPPVSNTPSTSSISESTNNSPSTSSVKILERLGPSAKFKRKPVPPPLAVITTPMTPTNIKDSPVLPSPESTTPTNTGTNPHHSPVTVSSPVLQHQLSTPPAGLKSILKQRSLSNPSSNSSLSPTNERKSSTNYVSPLASNETRPALQITSTNNRSTSIDSTTKRTPPSTPTVEKKKSLNQQDIFTNDIDERQADEKKSTWRTPPTKHTLSNESNSTKKQTLDKIPKKPSATTPKPVITESTKLTTKITKTTKSTVTTPLGTKVPQLTLERLDAKSLKAVGESTGKSSSSSTLSNKSVKLKRTTIIQSDSETEKKSSSISNVQKVKKPLLNNEITKRKLQHQQKPMLMKKSQLIKTKNPSLPKIRKQSTTDAHSSDSEIDEKKSEQTTTTNSDHEEASSDNDDKSQKDSMRKRTKIPNKNKLKSPQSTTNWREPRQDTSMYDRIKKRARSEQTRNSSLSTNEGDLSDENSDNNDNDDDDDRDDHVSSRPSNIALPKQRPNPMSDSSDSGSDKSSKTTTKKSTIFDNNVFDAEGSDEKNSIILPKKKLNQLPPAPAASTPPSSSQTKKPILKANNEQPKKDKISKPNDEESMIKKKISLPKPVDKNKTLINPTKSIPKISKIPVPSQKRPSTDESNESTKKLKTDDNKMKPTLIEEQTSSAVLTKPDSQISISNKPSIIITSPTSDSPVIPPKTDGPSNDISTETNSQTTPTKFGIVFPSHHRQSTTTPSTSIRTQSTETSTNHETSKNDDEEMDEDNESVSVTNNTITKDETIVSTNTLKPPATTSQPPLSDDETLNPETMQLSDLIGSSRREGTKPVQSRSANKTAGKGKRIAKQVTSSNKRQQIKTNSKPILPSKSNEKVSESSIPPANSTLLLSTPLPSAPLSSTPLPSTLLSSTPLPSTPEPSATISINTKRLSTTESSSVSSPIHEKEPKRLRTSTDESTSQIKPEPIENPSQWTNTQVKEETIESAMSSEADKVENLPSKPIEQSQVITMETDQIPAPPSSSSITTSTQSPSSTSTETENAIKAVYSSIQIPQQPISKTPNVDKSSPIIAPITKETLPIVEHQPTSTPTASILPPHISNKSSLTSTIFNENVEETLSAVNSLLMLNNNPPNISGDHSAIKGGPRVAPTISKPVYSLVASLPSPTDQQSRQVPPPPPTTTSVVTPTTQQPDLIALVSNIVSSPNLNGEKQTPPPSSTTTTTAAATRSHIEEVIDDVAKGVSTTTTTVTEPTTSIVDTNSYSSSTSTGTTKSTPIPNILRDVMKTPCLTSSSSSSSTAATITTAASETLNLFDSHRPSISPLKTTTSSTNMTTTTTTNVSATITSSTPIVPVVVRPTISKPSSSHKRSSTPKTELPPPPPPVPTPMIHPFSHMLTPDGSLFVAAAAHHPNFPFSLFAPLPPNPANSTTNSSSNLLASSLVSNSPPLSSRPSSTSNNSSNIVTNPFLNTIMSGQQNSSSSNSTQHTHEKGSRRESSTKGSSTSSHRSTPIQQTVPVPIALNIPTSSSASSGTTNNVINQRQASPLLNTLDAAAAAMRQQASPLQQYLGPDSVVPFRNVYADPSELYGTPAGLYPSQNIAYAAAQQMLNVIGITGSHHPSAAAFAAELYSTADPYFRLNSSTNELSRDPYNVQWQGNLILKNDQAYVRTQLVAGSPQIARASMNYWNSDTLSSTSSNLQAASHHNLRISQRMRLEQAQLEGVQKRMQMDNDHCILIAEPNGSTPDEIRIQQNNLKNGVIRYFDEKKAAGIVNVLLPGASQPAYVVHIFPPCQFASEILQKRAPDTYRCVVQNKIEQIYLLIVITSTVQ